MAPAKRVYSHLKEDSLKHASRVLLIPVLLCAAAGVAAADAAADYPNRPVRFVAPDVQERFSTQGLDAVGSTPEAIATLIKQETAMYAKLVKQIGLQPQ